MAPQTDRKSERRVSFFAYLMLSSINIIPASAIWLPRVSKSSLLIFNWDQRKTVKKLAAHFNES
jgi:hypothetical protein